MRLCERNLKTIYYALYKGEEAIEDDDGNETGEYEITYNNPVAIKVNVSAARGATDVEIFGVELGYDKTLLTGDMNCPINETAILWVDKVPDITLQGTTETPYDYQVVKVAKSLNYIAYAIKGVNKS